jgi:hypothetical protein
MRFRPDVSLLRRTCRRPVEELAKRSRCEILRDARAAKAAKRAVAEASIGSSVDLHFDAIVRASPPFTKQAEFQLMHNILSTVDKCKAWADDNCSEASKCVGYFLRDKAHMMSMVAEVEKLGVNRKLFVRSKRRAAMLVILLNRYRFRQLLFMLRLKQQMCAATGYEMVGLCRMKRRMYDETPTRARQPVSLKSEVGVEDFFTLQNKTRILCP